MEPIDRPLEEVEAGDVVLHEGVPRVVADVQSSSAGKSGSAKVTLTFEHADDRLIDPADTTVPVLDIERASHPMITVESGDPHFDPPIVRVAAGSPVVWFWSGEGGTHQVVGDDFASMAHADAGYTVERSYDEPGVYPFRCDPHDAEGFVIVD